MPLASMHFKAVGTQIPRARDFSARRHTFTKNDIMLLLYFVFLNTFPVDLAHGLYFRRYCMSSFLIEYCPPPIGHDGLTLTVPAPVLGPVYYYLEVCSGYAEIVCVTRFMIITMKKSNTRRWIKLW